MRRVVAAALLAAVLAGCGTSSDDAGANGTPSPETTEPASTVERDRKQRDDDITQATADSLHQCTAVVAEQMHFDVSWLTDPPDTVADVDPALLASAQTECTTAKGLVSADLDPRAGIGQVVILDEEIRSLVDALNAPEVNLAANSGMAMMIINIQGTIDGTFGGPYPLVIT
jgi:hypothetical protein